MSQIMDKAGQKGTGKWTVHSSLETGVPVTLIGESVFARCLSAMKDERVHASGILQGPAPGADFTAEVTSHTKSTSNHRPSARARCDRVVCPQEKEQVVDDIRQALYASKIVSYAQGFMLMREEAKEQGWNLNYGGVALMWRGGCIIRSRFLGNIKDAFDKDPNLQSLLLDDFFKNAVHASQVELSMPNRTS